jgi:hypothetical protein
MLRLLAVTTLVVSSLFYAEAVLAQQSPPLCPQGSWAVRSSNGWTCSKVLPSDAPPAAASNNNSNSNTRGGHSRGGGMPQ